MAISDCRPPKVEDELIHYMVKDEKINLSKVYENEVPGSKYARLHYKLIGSKDGKFLFQIKLITGRSHQIRAQMAHIGCPLLGDVKYGKSLPKPAYELCLYAYQVAFTHPVLKERMVWTNFPDPTGYWKGMDEFFPLLK